MILQFHQVNEARFPFTEATLMLPQQNCVDLGLVVFLSMVLFVGCLAVVLIIFLLFAFHSPFS